MVDPATEAGLALLSAGGLGMVIGLLEGDWGHRLWPVALTTGFFLAAGVWFLQSAPLKGLGDRWISIGFAERRSIKRAVARGIAVPDDRLRECAAEVAETATSASFRRRGIRRAGLTIAVVAAGLVGSLIQHAPAGWIALGAAFAIASAATTYRTYSPAGQERARRAAEANRAPLTTAA